MSKRALLWSVMALVWSAACSRAPVAELEVAPTTVRLDFPRYEPVVFTWRLTGPQPAAGGLLVFVHLLDGDGQIVRTFDHELPEPWREGSTVRDELRLYQSELGAPLAGGQYQLVAGLYDRSGRLELGGPGERVRQGEYLVARVEVGPGGPEPGAPAFTFSESWWPVEPGTDMQVLGRRWLDGTGALRIAGTNAAGTLWLRFQLPALPAPGDPGIGSAGAGAPAESPALHIVNACAGATVDVAAAGIHDVMLAIPAGAASAGCEIQFQSNLTVPAPGETRSRSALLQVLSSGRAGHALARRRGAAAAGRTARGQPARAQRAARRDRVKDRSDAILRPAQAAYLERILPPREPLLAEMEAHALRDDVPVSDPEVGRLLTALALACGARRILEVGTAIGYGTLCLARGAVDAEVVTIDTDPARLATARGYLERAGVLPRVRLVEGPALEVVPGLEGSFDLVYIDALKTEYRRVLDAALPKLRVGGLVVADNLLWKGRIAEPPEPPAVEDEESRALRAFNGYLMSHPQLVAVVLPFGDGLGVAAKKKPLMTELGGPW